MKKERKVKTSASAASHAKSGADEKPLISGPLAYGLVVLGLLALVLVVFFPTLSGKSIPAHDYLSGLNITKELVDYYKENGETAGWTGRLFSGMPAFQVYYPTKTLGWLVLDPLFNTVNMYLYIGILIVLSGFILFRVLKLRPTLIFFGSSALLLGTFLMISLVAGHNNKVMVIALTPITLAGTWLLYEQRKYALGVFLVALSVSLQIRSNHFQITYFLFLFILIWSLVNAVFWIRARDFKHMVLCAVLMALGVGLGAASNAKQLLTTSEYTAETQRGGPSPVQARAEAEKENAKTSSGLDFEYATSWSYGKLESFTLLIPNFMGGASQDSLGQDSHTYQTLVSSGVPAASAAQFCSGLPTYWGAQPYTAGTTYIGAVLLVLFFLSLYFLDRKWTIVLATGFVFTLFIAWGKNFEVFYSFLFKYLPFFNKFRTPAMIFYLSTLLTVVGAVMFLQYLVNHADRREELWEPFKKLSIGILAFFAFMALIAPSIMSFESMAPAASNPDVMMEQQLMSATGSNQKMVNEIITSIRADRKSMMQKDAFRSLVLVALVLAMIALFIKRKVKAGIMLAIVTALGLIDVGGVSGRYMKHSLFQTVDKTSGEGAMTAADRYILQDKDISYRVFDLTHSSFNDATATYHHKNIGGYHSAKLKRYQDIITYKINDDLKKLSSGSPEAACVLNMLNTRYIISGNAAEQVFKNEAAYGNAWLIDTLVKTPDPLEAFDGLSERDLSQVAFAEENDLSATETQVFERDTAASIRLESYSPEVMKYSYQSATPSFAVFSEIYYNAGKGWNAYVDGEYVEHYRTNYVLRGMQLPAGAHAIEFRFEPASVSMGARIDWIASLLIILVALGALYENRRSFSKNAETV